MYIDAPSQLIYKTTKHASLKAQFMEACCLVAIAGVTFLVPCPRILVTKL